MRVVLDVNVLVSGFPAPGGVPATLIERWLRWEFELILSEHILDGVTRAWNSPCYRARYQYGKAQRALGLLRARAVIVTPVSSVRGVGDDEADDVVVATAIAGRALYLVTGDNGLQAVGRYQDTTILSPREFLERLEQVEGNEGA